MSESQAVQAITPSPMVFHRIRLVNFVIHRDTTIQLDTTPITFITGSNGSGKTLILDALLLAIGVDSKRANRQRNSTFIGPFGKTAEILLELNNFRINGERIIRSPDSELNRLLNNEQVNVRVRILSSNRITFWINDKRTIDNRRITRQDIRQIFHGAGIWGDNPLAVTEAETLDQFASQTPRKKFETFLYETGLKEWMEKLEEAKLLVQQAQSNITPLRTRLRHEEQRLQVLKTAYEAFQQKEQLKNRIKELHLEAAWSEVVYREGLVTELEAIIRLLEDDMAAEQNELDSLRSRRKDLEQKRQNIQTQRNQLQSQMNELRDEQMQARGQRLGLTNELKRLQDQITRYQRKKSKTRKTLSTKEEVIREELDDFLQERDKYDDQLTELRRQITATEEELAAEPQRYSSREGSILRACVQYRKELDTKPFGSEVIGPIFTLIRMKRGEEHFEIAVKLALGRYTYAFLALSRGAFKAAKELFDHLWPYSKPNLVVARINSEGDEPRKRLKVTFPIHAWATDLLQGDPSVLAFLSRVVNTAVTERSTDPNLLADAAQKLNGNIITEDGLSHYLRIGAFSRPPLPVAVPLGVPLPEIGLAKDTSSVIKHLRELREQEATILRDRMRINAEISQLRSRLHELRSDQVLEASQEDRNLVVNDLERQVDLLHQQITEIDAQLDIFSQQFQQCNAEFTPLLSRLQTTENQLRRLDIRIDRHEQNLNRLTQDLQNREGEHQHLAEQLKEHRTIANDSGPCPEIVRDPSEVREEQLQVQAMIDAIPATAKDRDVYEEQEKLVNQLQQYLKDRQKHLENLMRDVQQRLLEWRRHLEETLELLNNRMNQLISHFIKQVHLTVRYPDEPSRSELHIQIAINRKDAWRTYENMSGGEKVLGTQIFILALHTMAKSPLHIIDEVTQRLDEASRSAVLSIVQRAIELSQENSMVSPQFLLMAPSTLGLQIPTTMHHIVLIKGEVET